MSNPHWALKNIHQEVTGTGYKILVWSFQPCHLWLRYTLFEPQEHIKPRTLRGVSLLTDKRFCFVAYHDIEQVEGLDTYLHTFTLEPWPHCQTRWFYFHGKMGGEYSPSTSAIFKKHRIQPPIPQEITIISHTADGAIATYFKNSYALAHDQVLGERIDNTTTTAEVGQTVSGGRYYLWRSFLFFDTSPLAGATIESAYLKLRNQHKFAGPPSHDLIIQSGMPSFPHKAMM